MTISVVYFHSCFLHYLTTAIHPPVDFVSETKLPGITVEAATDGVHCIAGTILFWN